MDGAGSAEERTVPGGAPAALDRAGAALDAALARLAAWAVARPGRGLALLFAAALLAFFPGQTALPPSDRDEARFAQASRQMLETGDFLDIRFQDEARHKKPVGIYWLQAAAASPFGGADAPIWAFRLPSLLGAAAAVALAAWALAPLIGWPAALLAGALTGLTPLLHVEARIAKTDAALLAAILLAQGAMLRVWLVEGAARWAAPLLWVAVGAGVLLKGPVILLPVAGTVAWLCVAERGAARLRALRPLMGLGVVAAIAGPWLVAITLASDGAFWAASVGEDLFGKVASGQEAHGAPPGFHLLAFWAAAWPWAVLAPLAAVALWARRGDMAGRVLMGWIVPMWLVFELVPTKLPHYVLPAYPALAAAVALALLAPGGLTAPGWSRRAALAVWAIPAAVLAVGALAATPVVEGRVEPLAWALATPGALALAAAGRALWFWRPAAFLGRAAVGAVLLYAAAFGAVLPSLRTGFVAPRLAEAAAPHRCGPRDPVALTGYREPSAVFMLGTDTRLTTGEGAAAALADGRAALAFVEARDLPAFLAAHGPAEPLAVVEGFNYSNGRRVALSLFPRRDAPDCPP